MTDEEVKKYPRTALRNYDAEFRLQKPETIGETDHTFDLSNYADFLENKIEQNIFDAKTAEEKKRVALFQKVVERLNEKIHGNGIDVGMSDNYRDLILETKLEE